MAVIADLIRNPVVAWHWIPDQVRDDKLDIRDDKTKGRGTFAESPTAARPATGSLATQIS